MREFAISDIHIPDPDVDLERLRGFLGKYGNTQTYILGDAFTSARFLAEALTIDGKWCRVRDWATSQYIKLISGNHDRALCGAFILGYIPDTVWTYTKFGNRVALLHGHQFDSFWCDGGSLSGARRWIGEEILKRAWLWDRPGEDDAPGRIMAALRWVSEHVVPKGARLDALDVAKKAAEWARLNGFDVVVMGHTHQMGAWEIHTEGRVVTVVNCGSWIRGERSGVYDLLEGRLYEWTGTELVPWEVPA